MRAIDFAHNDLNKADLYELVQKAAGLLDGWDEEHKGVASDLIRRHYFRVTSFEERFAELYDLAKGKRGKKADKELSELKERVEQLSIEVSNLKTLIAETHTQILPPNSSTDIIEAKPDVNEAMSMDTNKKEAISRDANKKGYTESDILKIREYLKTNQEIENRNVREICGIDTSLASLLLRKLVKDKTIKNIGTGKKSAKYVFVSTAVEVPAPIPTTTHSKKALTHIEIEQKLEQLRDYLKTNREIDNKKCREICNVNMKQASRLLHKLGEENFVEKGKGFPRNYVIKE